MKKILIADDERNMRWILEKNLKEAGFNVLQAEDGEQAFNLFLDEEPDMVILDYRMPNVDGMEALRRIKTVDSEVPIIMITAHGNTDAAVEAMKLGAVDYISKPFEIDDLRLSIDKALKIDRLTKEISYLKDEITRGTDKKIIGSNRKMREIFELVDRVAKAQMLYNGSRSKTQ